MNIAQGVTYNIQTGVGMFQTSRMLVLTEMLRHMLERYSPY